MIDTVYILTIMRLVVTRDSIDVSGDMFVSAHKTAQDAMEQVSKEFLHLGIKDHEVGMNGSEYIPNTMTQLRYSVTENKIGANPLYSMRFEV